MNQRPTSISTFSLLMKASSGVLQFWKDESHNVSVAPAGAADSSSAPTMAVAHGIRLRIATARFLTRELLVLPRPPGNAAHPTASRVPASARRRSHPQKLAMNRDVFGPVGKDCGEKTIAPAGRWEGSYTSWAIERRIRRRRRGA